MTNWRYKLELKKFKDQYENEEITIEVMSKKVIQKINEIVWKEGDETYKSYLDDIIDEFEICNDEDDFNNALESLYNWGDIELTKTWPPTRLCWIGFAL